MKRSLELKSKTQQEAIASALEKFNNVNEIRFKENGG